jgi:NTP pyrophosphatase (non-canonical NTP hydrolase)
MYDNVFDNFAIELHKAAKEKGFWPEEIDDIFIAKQCMMIVSEVTEVMEAVRKDKGEEEITKEFADIIIRTLDLYAGMVDSGYTRLSLDQALREKVEFNKTRPEKHGVRF